jgi:hypothetical protein
VVVRGGGAAQADDEISTITQAVQSLLL